MVSRYRETLKASIQSGEFQRTRYEMSTQPDPAPVAGILTEWIPEKCFDHLSDGWPWWAPDQSFELEKVVLRPPIFNGVRPNGPWFDGWEYREYSGNMYFASTTPSLAKTDLGYWRTELMARVNPSVPEVDVPANVLEMILEVPVMLRSIVEAVGRASKETRWWQKPIPVTVALNQLGPAAFAGSFVTYNFTIAPLVGLLVDLLSLQEKLDRQIRELTSPKEKKRRVELSHTTLQKDVTVYSYPPTHTVTHQMQISNMQRIWGTYRLKYADEAPKGTTVSERFAVRRAKALGLSGVGFETFWEAVPFSWLIDYFFNVGSFLAAYRGWANYSVSSLCIMCHETQTKRVFESSHGGQAAYVSCSNPYKLEDRKRRVVGGFPTISFQQRFLTPKQSGNLLSIAAALAFAAK